ncbi:MAG: hypothetical protein WA693_06450 [Pseudolabrys sp.]
MIKIGRSIPEDSLPDVSTVPVPPEEKSKDELLLELGDIVTLDHLDKELEVENKLMAKLDRLFKRFFQIKAMKPLIGLGEPLAPAWPAPNRCWSWPPPSKAPDVPGHTTECETAAAPI